MISANQFKINFLKQIEIERINERQEITWCHDNSNDY